MQIEMSNFEEIGVVERDGVKYRIMLEKDLGPAIGARVLLDLSRGKIDITGHVVHVPPKAEIPTLNADDAVAFLKGKYGGDRRVIDLPEIREE